ncbi:tellurium resistance protein TerC [freshwater metagenome]|uniref:Tellurium resistance protein TerC n=1 Tax=freshwater metagenome TaxID=449393 RepID=A0A094QW17_9ZZZZ
MTQVATISTTNWIITITALLVIIALDFAWAVARRKKDTSMREATAWSVFYVSLAVAFGLFLSQWLTSKEQQEFFAGWLTEYSLSFDNLFVFVLILTRLKIDKQKQQLALLIGILIALVLRIIAITLGKAAIEQFEWVFFIFGGFLIYTAVSLFMESAHKEEVQEDSRIIKFLRSRGLKPFTIALLALGMTDLLFALDSIPAIFGLTENVYIVITANIFALMGLRQLYFLIGGLMARLVYIGKGLSAVLAFIGFKLLFHAFHAVDVHEIYGWHIPEVTITQSLFVIVSCLVLATIASLYSTRKGQEQL